MKLADRKTVNTYGGRRIVAPDITLREAEKELSNEEVVKLSHQFGMDVPVYFVSANINGTPSAGMGKGVNDECAKTGAVMELIERYSARIVDAGRIIKGTYNSLKGQALDPVSVILNTDPAYNDDTEVDFVNAYMLGKDCEILVPAVFAHCAYNCVLNKGKLEYTRGGIHTFFSTSGLASGNCIEEAVMQGLYEVIEHDAVFTMWLAKLPMPDLINIRGVSSDLDRILDMFDEKNIELKLKLIQNDIEKIYTVFCSMINRSETMPLIPKFSFGSATHSNPAIALQKAVAEAGQSAIVVGMQSVNISNDEYKSLVDARHIENIRKFNDMACLEEMDFLLDSDKKADFWSLMDYSCENILDELKNVVGELLRHELDVMAVDLTAPNIGVPVVRIIVPGMQGPVKSGFSHIYSKRLFDAPVKLGLKPLAQEDINTFELI